MAESDGPMHVVCATDANYLRHCAAMIASLLAFNPRASVHVLCDVSVSEIDRQQLVEWARTLGAELECLVPEVKLPAQLPGLARLTRAAWLRLFAANLLPHLSRAIYLDVDVVVQDSLNDLWNLDLKDHWVAAVSDVPHVDHLTPLYRRVGFDSATEYFNSGVMVLDLDVFRRERIGERALQFAIDHPEQVLLADQDPLNVLLRSRRLALPLRWNALAPLFEGGMTDRTHSAVEERQARDRPAVVHFSGPWKPWHVRSRHPLRRLYAEYRAQTPWPEWQPDGRTFKHRLLRLLPEAWERRLKELRGSARGLIPSAAK